MRKRHSWFTFLALTPALVLGQSLPDSAPVSAPASAPVIEPAVLSLGPGPCGNGALNTNEECDDGNILNGDGCSIICRVEGCGDNALQANEQCDDGNNINGDGCSATCASEKSHRSLGLGFVLSAAVTLSGLPISRVTGSSIPSIISFGIGPTVGRLYLRDYRKAGLYTGLRAAALGVAFVGLEIAGNSFRAENINNGIPFDAFPGDGTFFLGGLLLIGGAALYPTIAIFDLSDLLLGDATRQRRLTMLPAPMTFGRGSLGMSLQGRF